MIGAILYWYSIMFLVAMGFLTVLFLLFSPVAGAVSALVAKSRGMSVVRHGIIGAILSVMFLAPWVYLLIRMLGRRPPDLLVKLAYGILLFSWIMGPIGGTTTLMFVASSNDSFGILGHTEPMIAMTAVNVLTLVLSVLALDYDGWPRRFEVGEGPTRLKVVHLAPFALGSAWSLVVVVAMLASG